MLFRVLRVTKDVDLKTNRRLTQRNATLFAHYFNSVFNCPGLTKQLSRPPSMDAWSASSSLTGSGH